MMAKAPAQSSRGVAQTPSVAAVPLAQRDATSTESHPASRSVHAPHTQPVIRGPASGRMVRSFSLPDSDGRPVNLWNYRQRANLVLFFHHGSNCPECRALLRDLAANAAVYREEEAMILAVGPDAPEEARHLAAALDCSFPLLCDPTGGVVARQVLDVPSLIVADRYGEIWAGWHGGGHGTLPSTHEVHRWLEFVELQCPECSHSEWPPLPHGVVMD